MIPRIAIFLLIVVFAKPVGAQENNQAPEGFRALFNGQDLAGWHGEATMSPAKLAVLPESELHAKQQQWQQDVVQHWRVDEGELVNDGEGVYLTSDQQFGDVELWI
ncbi:MAG: family 16 glycoside hydrolase, partial [Aeoliella sp.]